MPAQRKQPVFGRVGQVVIGQEAIDAGGFGERFDRKTRVKGQRLQIGVLINDARSDQHLVRTDAEFPATRFGCSQQRGREHLSQAIQLARRAQLPQPVVVA